MSESTGNQEKNRAALASLVCTLFLVGIKIAAGLYTNSLGILSEALHSALDLLAAAITWFAVRVSSRPADKGHPYGYGKIENLSALVETILLLVTCGWIIHEAVNRLFFESPQVLPSLWGAGIILISLLIDVNRARMLHRVAEKHKSQALEADALHFSTDIWSSAVVLVGLLCLQISTMLPQDHFVIEYLCKADAFAALIVAGIVLLVSLRLSRQAVTTLLDGGGSAYADALEQALAEELPSCEIRRLRVRESGADIFMDLILEAPSTMSLDEAHNISDSVERIGKNIAPGADITVHVEPANSDTSSPLKTARSMAAAHNLSVHNMLFSMQEDGLLVLLHVEAPPNLSLEEAHARVDAFEFALGKQLHGAHIVSHIEPEENNSDPAPAISNETGIIRLQRILRDLQAHFSEISAIGGLRVFKLGRKSIVTLHCNLPSDMTVAQSHTIASELEKAMRKRVPDLYRIIIHTDPEQVNSPQASRRLEKSPD